ncbi:MAG: hypothetical protein LJE59_01815 [Chromatiaceae bacterium]|nr:hypothetical protein [Chromatiaceae bacterium]
MHTPPSIVAAKPFASRLPVLLILCLSIIAFPLCASGAGLAHDMTVLVAPDSGEIEVDDHIGLGEPRTHLEFVLNAGLTVTSQDGALQRIDTSADGLRNTYRITLQTAGDTLQLHYHGKPRFSARRGLGDMPQGTLSAHGVYLDGASAWYPLFDRDLGAVRMHVTLPEGWQAVSIGERSTRSDGSMTWTSTLPHDDLYLIAGRFTRHARRHGTVELSVWLLDDDPALAQHYLDLMGGYIDHYSRMIGDYPYAKFAVVENRWETGFGMPSFTLLGARVMRLPFIPYTSLPHEILHNWWGNGVWVDYAKGNWSEGLTAYLSDHWMQERAGKGDQYRLKALQRYSNFAAEGGDQALLGFVSRHNDASQSIGYSKSLMLFHMLRNTLGDAAFVDGLRQLWQRHRFTRVGFAAAIRAITAPDDALAQRLMPWLERTGAPQIRLQGAALVRHDDAWELTMDIDQGQQAPFEFDLPVWITLDGETIARRELAHISARNTRLSYRFDRRPLRVDIDPEYDVLRYLDPTEQPPALNRLFGSKKAWLVVPGAAPAEMRAAWRDLAATWQQLYPALAVIDDSAAHTVEAGADRILLGWDNALLDGARAGFARDDQALGDREVSIGQVRYPAAESSVVLVSSDAQGVTTGFIGAASTQAIQALARKLPHYGSYGRLLFDPNGNKQLADALDSTHSQLSRQLSETPVPLRLPARPVLGGED